MKVGRAFEKSSKRDPIASYGLCHALCCLDSCRAGTALQLKKAHGGSYGMYWFPVRNTLGHTHEYDI